MVLLAFLGHRQSQRGKSKELVLVADDRTRSPYNLRLEFVNSERQIVPGITFGPSGQATIDPSIKDVLFDLAIALEEPTNLPVDIEHVVAAIVLAARNNDIDANKDISENDPELIRVLAVHVKSVFALYGGKVSSDE